MLIKTTAVGEQILKFVKTELRRTQRSCLVFTAILDTVVVLVDKKVDCQTVNKIDTLLIHQVIEIIFVYAEKGVIIFSNHFFILK